MSTQPQADNARTERIGPTPGRVSLFFSLRYATPILVLLAIAASTTHPNLDRLTGLLTAQVALAVATHAMAARGGTWVGRAIWIGMITDITAISALVALTGGSNGPLVFLYTVSALAAGILLSSRAGLRAIVLSSIAIMAMDLMTHQRAFGTTTFFPRGLAAV